MRSHFLLSIGLIVWLVGCGYKPASTFARAEVGEKLFADVIIDLQNPQNSVLIKDALNEAIVKHLHGSITDKKTEENTVTVRLKGIDFDPLLYDDYGYVSVYRALVSLEFRYRDQVKLFHGKYDFSTETSSIISYSDRYRAIYNASDSALREFLAYIAAAGHRRSD